MTTATLGFGAACFGAGVFIGAVVEIYRRANAIERELDRIVAALKDHVGRS